MKTWMKLSSVCALAACATGALAQSAASGHEPAAKAAQQRNADIVDTAVAAGSFKTLAAALQAAGLVKTLKGKGPFTVFAPTDEAFAKLPAGTVESLLKPKNNGQLASILTYHAAAGNVAAKQAMTLKHAATVNGQRIDLSTSGDQLKLDRKAAVVKADSACSNGIIHVIDTVLMPK